VTTKLEADDRGRVTIPEETRERYGNTFRLVELGSGLKLVPIPDDPVETLRAAGSTELRSASLDELEAAASETAREESSEYGH
jgi:bifunctional DNA-binding transcriptional regulator/antitoxin component of YhaV-PrlF toxin-antitoxin module